MRPLNSVLSLIAGLASAALLSFSPFGGAATSPQEIQGYIAHANPARALELLAPILKADPHSAKAWYLKAEALDAQGHDPQAKQALSVAEHLSPDMPFANPRALRKLEQRVGLTDVQAAKTQSHLWSILAFFLLLVLISGVGVIGYLQIKQRKVARLAENDRSDLQIALTEFLTGDLNKARISADAQGDTARLASFQNWQRTLTESAQTLKSVANAGVSEKQAATQNARNQLARAESALLGATFQSGLRTAVYAYGQHPLEDAIQPTTLEKVTAFPTALDETLDLSKTYPRPVAPRPVGYYPENRSNGGFGSALEEGLGLGLGLEVAEDLLGAGRGSEMVPEPSFDNNGNDGSGSRSGPEDADPFQGGGLSSGWGSTDAGLISGGSGGSDGADAGSTWGDDSGSTDDGLTDSSDSW